MNDSMCYEAAYHELGHAIILWRQGWNVEYASMAWDEGMSQWTGETRRGDSRIDMDSEGGLKDFREDEYNRCLYLFSGCLAQSKYRAQVEHGDVKYSSLQEWNRLLEWMRRCNADEECELRFDTSDGTRPVSVDPRSFSGSDQAYFKWRIQSLQSVGWDEISRKLVEKVKCGMLVFDDASVWSRVRLLAEELVASVVGGKGKIGGERIDDVLKGGAI